MIKTIKENLLVDNGFIKLYNDKVQLPDENEGQYVKISFSQVDYAVAGVALTKDKKIILFNHFRYAPQEKRIETVKGLGEPDLITFKCFEKKLEEEIGATSNEIIYMGESNNDTHTGKIHCFLAKNIVFDENLQHESGEVIDKIKAYSIDDVKYMLKNNLITDNITQSCLLQFLMFYNEEDQNITFK